MQTLHAGVVLGAMRVFWVVPRLGERIAELMEAPLRWVTRWLVMRSTWSTYLGMGGVALGLLLIAELTLVRWLRSLSIGEDVASRDPGSGTAYILMLGVFALMPLLVARCGA